MTDKYQRLLIEWCDALLAAQITDTSDEYFGGFRCDSCAFPHGRADNAIYPLVAAYTLTGNGAYLESAERLLAFRKKLEHPDGSVQNDFASSWEGITAFSAIGLMKTLLYFGDVLPPELKSEIEESAIRSARWVHEKMTIGFPAYVNYYCAAALVNALYYESYRDEAYKARAEELLSYCLGLFTENGLLAGEGKPHDDLSPKGCAPIDVGYIVEESMPCLIHAAALLRDVTALNALTDHARNLLDFMLPDGGWDNSFGVRNNKWTYYGSRTSDGCIGAFAFLAAQDEIFAEAAERTYEILSCCTYGGKLYGGRRYYENGQKPCIHHTFCHAGALADAILAGIKEPAVRRRFPSETRRIACDHYPESEVYKIRAGRYSVTVSAYDYVTHHFSNGAAHAGGAAISLLYKDGVGPIIAGSVYEYRQTEPNNMQRPEGALRHATLIPRVEYEKDGVRYATCLDRASVVLVSERESDVLVIARSHFLDTDGNADPSGDPPAVAFTYHVAPSGVTICVSSTSANMRFVLPVVEGSCKVLTENRFTKEKIFFLPGGFAAEEYVFPCEGDLTITIK